MRLVGACAGQNRCTKKNEVDAITAKSSHNDDDDDIESLYGYQSGTSMAGILFQISLLSCVLLFFVVSFVCVRVHARLIADSFSFFPSLINYTQLPSRLSSSPILQKIPSRGQEVKGIIIRNGRGVSLYSEVHLCSIR